MTDQRPLLPVTQGDRDAAADFLADYAGGLTHAVRAKMLAGDADYSKPVQAFAQHRLKHQPCVNLESVAEIVFDAMRWAADQICTDQHPSWVPRGNSYAQDRARDVARAILRVTAEQDGWQPIESYERDCETEIDMWCQGTDGDGWNLRGILMIGAPDWVKRTDATDYWPHENGCVITHFRPLPTPPANILDSTKEAGHGRG